MVLSPSGSLGQLGQYGHCICWVEIIAIVEIRKCASVCISGLLASNSAKQKCKVPSDQTVQYG